MKKKIPFKLGVAGITWIMAGSAYAGGFQISEQSVVGMGRAFAGYGMVADDASAVFYNPAGMTALKGTQIQGMAYYLSSHAKFKNKGTSLTVVSPGGPLTFPDSGSQPDGGDDSPFGGGYFKIDINDWVAFGLGMTVPFGLVTDYANRWVGRYHALRSEVKTIDINPSLAFRIAEGLSIGVGASAQYVEAKLSRALFLVNPTTGAQLPDGKAKVKGNDWSAGYNVGVMYEFGPNTRFGVGFRSKVEYKLKGDLKIRSLVRNAELKAKADLTLPETVHIGIFHRFDDHWSVALGARWTNWSRFKELRVRSPGLPDQVTKENWNDSWTANIGVNYDLNPAWSFRAGYAFDETPVPNSRLRTPRIPDNTRHWLTAGASYHYGEAISVDIAYAHIFVEDTRIDNTIDLVATKPGLFRHQLVGKFDSSVNLGGIQMTFRF